MANVIVTQLPDSNQVSRRVKPASISKPLAFVKLAGEGLTDGCVIWPFGARKGYGRLRYRGSTVFAHRLALAFRMERDLSEFDDLFCAHDPILCSSPSCINPAHLRWTDHAGNMRDMLIAGTTARGVRNPHSKLVEADVYKIREDVRPQKEIASEYGISQVAVSHIKTRKTWGWLRSSLLNSQGVLHS